MELDERSTIGQVRSCLQAVRREEAEVLQLAAHWADLHAPDPRTSGMRAERSTRFGGDGTPEVGEFAPAELGPEVGLSLYQSQALIADALDLRHRLPRVWARVLDLRVEVWRARLVARRTRELSVVAAEQVDRTLAAALETVPWGRFTELLAAEILRADPRRAQRLAELAARSRFVCTGPSTEHGIKGLYARMDAPDAIWLDGMINRLADILAAALRPIPGVPARNARTRDEWRAVALGLLARPLLAARILIDHEQPALLQEAGGCDEGRAPQVPDPAGPELSARPELLAEPTAACGGGPAPHAPDSAHPARQSAGGAGRERALRRLLRGLPPERLASPAVLYLHIAAEAVTGSDAGGSAGVARVEGVGPTLLGQVRDWLGPGCRVRLQPVLDPAAMAAVDGYEIPPRMREALFARTPASVFPYATNRSRRMDLDHTVSWVAGPAGQTGLHNLGPLGRAEHRFKTHGRLGVRQPIPNVYIWRTRFGRTLVTDSAGTHDLGIGEAADTVWRIARASGPTGADRPTARDDSPVERAVAGHCDRRAPAVSPSG